MLSLREEDIQYNRSSFWKKEKKNQWLNNYRIFGQPDKLHSS
jgi:hypothetical protein